MSSEQEILSFEIVIDTKLSDETKKNLEELKSAQEEIPSETAIVQEVSEEDRIREGISGLEEVEAGELEFSEKELEQIRSTVGDTLGGIDKADIAQFGIIAKNPAAFGQNSVAKALTSRVPAIMGPLALAVATPVVMVEVIKALSVKGGPLNRDWRRFIQNEVSVGLSREQQQEDKFGVSQTILTQVRGFVANNENWTFNNLFDVNDARIARIGMSDREAGVTMFLP